MNALFKRQDGVGCRNCGAVQAAPETAADYGMCESCQSRYLKYCRYGNHPDNEISANVWIARQLFLSARRLQKFGVTGRCEAITDGSRIEFLTSRGPRSGYQCARQATLLRDGRKVCAMHGKIALRILFVETGGDDNAYGEFGRIIKELSLIDQNFLVAAEQAVADAKATLLPLTTSRV